MRDEDKSKEQLLKELKELRRQAKRESSRDYPLFAPIMETDPAGQAADELEQSISLLKATLESTADGLLVIDSSGRIVAFNQKFAQMWRIDASVLETGDDDRVLAFVLEQLTDPERFLNKVRELYGQPEAESYDLLEFKDGRVFERYSQPQRIGRTVVGRVWSFRDVTQRKQAEDALRESEEHYRSLFDNMLNGLAYCQMIFEQNRPVDFIYLNVNSAFEVMTGLKEVTGKKVSEVIPGIRESDPELFEIYGRVALTGKPERFETYVEALGMWFSISVYSLRKEYFVAIFDVITERKRAEEALAEEAIRRRILVEQSRDGIVVIDQTGKVYEANQRYAEMLGYSPEEVRQLYVWDWDAQWTREELLEQIRRVDVAGDHFETRHRRKDGTIFEVEISTNGAVLAGQKLVFCVCRDISQRKAAERALQESEEKYRLLVNQIPAVVFKGYADWRVDFFDNKIEALTGYSKEEFDSHRINWNDVTLPEDLDYATKIFIDALKTDGSYMREHRILRKDGEIRWVQCWGQIFCDPVGKIDFVSGVTFDITERKRAEEALLKYEFIANTAKDCMTLIDRNYVYEAANAAYCQAHGKAWEEVVGTGVADIWGADSFEKVIKGFLDRCFAGQPVEFEGWFEFGKQGRGCYHVFYSPYFDAQGTVAYAAVVSHNITERKMVEEALRQSEVKYRQLVDQIPAVVYRGYTDWSLDCFDRKIEDITGYAMEEFNSRRKTWLDLILPEDIDQAKKIFKEAQECECSYVSEHRIHKKTGEIRWIQARNRIICDAAGKFGYISGVFFDITERKELQEQLNKAQRMEAIGILAGGLAHDFNNLLTAIMGYSEIMMMSLRKEDPFHLYVEEITKAATRGAALTSQLLAFSRKQILQPRVINLNDVVIDLEKMLRRLIGEDIELITCIDQELGFVKADPGQIEQIIMNLAVNARDALPDGGKLTVETANVYLDEAYARGHVDVTPGHYVMLAVSDNGVGMDAETIARMFDPFFTTKESGKGTGLGLATVYGIVQQSGGHIWVDSEPGKGTTFKVYLSRVEEKPVELKPKAAAPTSPEGNETILVVEDDAALRDLISTALRKYGFKVLEAPHGGEALLICEREKAAIHLMLTDVVMPQISGTALADRLKLLHPEMKVLYMSGYTEDAIVHHGVLNSQVNFIPKPFRVLALVQKVREVLDSPEEETTRH